MDKLSGKMFSDNDYNTKDEKWNKKSLCSPAYKYTEIFPSSNMRVRIIEYIAAQKYKKRHMKRIKRRTNDGVPFVTSGRSAGHQMPKDH